MKKHGNEQSANVNTRALQFINPEGILPSTLYVGYWNDALLSIRINTLKVGKFGTEFDFEDFLSTAINPEKAFYMVTKIKNELFPAIEAGNDYCFHVSIAGNTLISMGTGKKEFKKVRPYLAIHRNLDEDMKPRRTLSYEFKRITEIKHYNKDTGEMTMGEGDYFELKLFLKMLCDSIVLLSGGSMHFHKLAKETL